MSGSSVLDLLKSIPGALKQKGIDITPQSHREYVNDVAPRHQPDISPLEVLGRSDIAKHPNASNPQELVHRILSDLELPVGLTQQQYFKALLSHSTLSVNKLKEIGRQLGLGEDTPPDELLTRISEDLEQWSV